MGSFINILGREIPLYGIFFFLGIGVAAAVAAILHKNAGLDMFDIAGSGVYIMIGAIIGAKLLFIAVTLPQIIEMNIPFTALIKGGFVFYGGLLGGAGGLLIYVRQFKMQLSPFADLYTTVLPLGHAFGRVGCFCAGCCYGIPWKHGHIYTSTAGTTPLGVPLLPIQLIESAALLVLFGVQIALYLCKRRTWRNTLFYFIAYPALRFVLEFFRGDTERGKIAGFSTSQLVSLLVIALLIIITSIFSSRKHKESKKI